MALNKQEEPKLPVEHKIGGDDQDQYVGCGNGSRHYNILKFNRFFQAGCNIKYEQDLDKF